MATMKIEKRNALPAQPQPNTMYLVKSGDRVRMYVADNSGAVVPVAGQGNVDEIEPFLLLGVTGE